MLELFLSSVNVNWGLWPSRIRVDYGVENVLTCESMVAERGLEEEVLLQAHQREIRGSSDCGVMYSDALQFCFIVLFMEQSGLVDVESLTHLFTLH